MALKWNTILAGASASHKVLVVEAERRDLITRQETERNAAEQKHSAIDEERQTLLDERARIDAALEALNTQFSAFATSQAEFLDRQADERSRSTGLVQEANDGYIRVMETAMAESGKSSDELAPIFDKQRDLLIEAGILTLESAEEPTEPGPTRSEREYRRGRRKAATDTGSAAPASPTTDGGPAAEDSDPSGEGPVDPVTGHDEGVTLRDGPVDRDDGTGQSAVPVEDNEGRGETGEDAEQLARTPAQVTVIDANPPAAATDDDWFKDVRRIVPPTAVEDVPAEDTAGEPRLTNASDLEGGEERQPRRPPNRMSLPMGARRSPTDSTNCSAATVGGVRMSTTRSRPS